VSHDFDDDFAVYPFRRVLVEETPDELPPALPRRPRPAPRRTVPSPLKLAVPLAVTTFVVAIAGAATISNRSQVQHAIGNQIVPAAEAAAPKRRHVAQPKLVFVPDVTGLKPAKAVKLLKQMKFHPRIRRIVGKRNVILEQKPRAATEVKRAGVVVLLAGGAKPKAKPKPVVAPKVDPTVIVTSVVGLDRDTAVHALLNEGLGVRIYGVPSAQPAGTVVAQSPAPGARAKSGTYARINVAVRVR
jgi:hypothetical protein